MAAPRRKIAHDVGTRKRSHVDLRPFTVRIVDEKDGWFSAFIPQLEGVCGQGRTRASARRSVLSALQDALNTWTARGWRVPWRRGS